MKKNFIMFASIATTATLITACNKEDEAPKKNYYGVEPNEGTKATKEAYITFFIAIVAFVFFVIWGIKKLRK